MTVDERARHQLFRRLQEVLGEEEATTLMERLPPEGYDRLATRQDLDLAKQELRAEINRVARQQTFALTTIFAVLNGVVFAALRLT